MKQVVRRILPCECPNCETNTLSLYDRYDRKINYSLLCKYNDFDKIQKKFEKIDLRYLRCDNCKSVFILDWTNTLIPYPTTKEKYKEFED